MSICTTGGQGCVFYPELECTDPTLNHAKPNQYISKLQTTTNTRFEYSIISYLKKIIPQYVPDYSKYIVLDDITVCVPKLSRQEIQSICPKCTIPYENSAEVSIMNIPYKGLALNRALLSNSLVPELWNAKHYTNLSKVYSKAVQYYRSSPMPIEKLQETLTNPEYFGYITIEYSFKTINNRLIRLYQNVIQVINRIGIYHSDIKASNVLINIPPNPTKYQFHHAHLYLIDWGVANLSTNNVIKMNRQLCIPLVAPAFMGYFNSYASTSSAYSIVLTYFITNPIQITGHVSIINDSLNILTGTSSGYICGLHPVWFNHLVQWVSHIKQTSNPFEHIRSVVLHNKDIAGFMSIYTTMYASVYYNYVVPTASKYPDKITSETYHDPIYKFYKQLGRLCLSVMVETFSKISPETLIEQLTQLNTYLT
jgi:serine/threonine protein kinase